MARHHDPSATSRGVVAAGGAARPRRPLHGLFAVLALAAGGALGQPMSTAQHDRLADKAAREGSVRVIVGMTLPTKPEGRLSAQAVAQQRAVIRAAQSAAVSQLLGAGGGRAHALFATLPHFAAEVDGNALVRMRASPLLASIEEDVPVPPELAQSAPLINTPAAWNSGRTGAGWVVAVLDTGVDKTHPFLTAKVVSEACYSSTVAGQSNSVCTGGAAESTAPGSAMNCNPSISGCTHGTHVAGIIAGTNAPDGSHGVARSANLIAIQVFSYFPAQAAVMSYTSDQIKGLERVLALKDTYPIAAVNMSLGGGQYTASCDGTNTAIKAAIDNLRSVGIATVIASGNNGFRDSISAPACVSSAVSVGATCDAADTGNCLTGVGGVASYSNIASFVSVLAPGSTINSSIPGGAYASWNGTSMAAPHVAGAWALMKQADPTLSVTDGLAALRSYGGVVADTRSGGTASGLRRIDLGFLSGNAYALTVTRSGAGIGTVGSSPAGIACGTDCAESYAEGQSVTLGATPAAGSTFAGWSGACSGTGTCTVSMTQARAVTATFNATPYTLTLTRTGAGSGTITSSPAGISCTSNCSAAFGGGTVVTLTPTAAVGSRFAGWSGACTGTANCTLTMTAARSVTASFALLSHAVTVAKSGTGAGTITSNPAGLNCGSTCSVGRTHGSVVTLNAAPTAGSRFDGWTGACSGTGTCTLNVTGITSATAVFNRTHHELSLTKGGNGAGAVASTPAGLACTASCRSMMPLGAVVSLSATPAAGSVFTGWSGACAGAHTCEVSMNSAVAVTANFARIAYPLVLSRDGTGTGSVTSSPSGINCGSVCTASPYSGTVLTLTARPAADSVFTGWTGACSGGAATCTVSMSEARSVGATFTQVKVALSTTRTGTGSGTVNSAPAGIACSSACSALMPIDSTVALAAVPAAESAFAGWSGACAGTEPTCTVSMSAARSVAAAFTRTHYTLTVAVPAVNGGTVDSSPAAIACGSTCRSSLPLGSTVTLVATPAAGWRFTGWSGACSGTGACAVLMSAARNVTANFARITYALTISRNGAGAGSITSSPSGISCGSVCNRSFNEGTSVTLSAAPSSTSAFYGWTGACTGLATCTVTMDMAKAVSAAFGPR